MHHTFWFTRSVVATEPTILANSTVGLLYSTPQVSLSGLSGNITGPVQVTASFNYNVSGLEASDLVLTNLSVSNFTQVDARTYTFDVTPAVEGTVSVRVPTGAAQTLYGKGNRVSNLLSATHDLTSPSVAISGVPTEITGPVTFDTTVTFNEDVVGFTSGDLNVSGGSVTALTGGPSVYTATISADGNQALSVQVPAAAAQDGAGNDNTASAVASASHTTPGLTGEQITRFLQTRTNALLAHQPEISGFLASDGLSKFDAQVTRSGGFLSYSSQSDDRPSWALIDASWSNEMGAEGAYIFGVVGVHNHVSESAVAGVMLQVDYSETRDGVASASGTGWLAGPYAASRHADHPLFFEASVLYGRTSNSITPLGTYTDSFSTERWLATLGVNGEIELERGIARPFLDASYASDAQAEYVDGQSNLIPAQTITLTQLEAGMDFELPLDAATHLTGGVSGILSRTGGTGASLLPGYEGQRAQVDLGFRKRLGEASDLNFGSYFDGIGTPNYERFGLSFEWRMRF